MSTSNMSTSNERSEKLQDQTFSEITRRLNAVGGDLGKLTPDERTAYYLAVCESLGLNPLTRPFEFIYLNGRLTLYARKDATDQLRRIHGISISITSRELLRDDGLYVVTARARTKDGREDEAVGAVSILGLKGEALANALMKAETKAKRRVTLSVSGLGFLDETETESIQPEVPPPPPPPPEEEVPPVADFVAPPQEEQVTPSQEEEQVAPSQEEQQEEEYYEVVAVGRGVSPRKVPYVRLSLLRRGGFLGGEAILAYAREDDIEWAKSLKKGDKIFVSDVKLVLLPSGTAYEIKKIRSE